MRLTASQLSCTRDDVAKHFRAASHAGYLAHALMTSCGAEILTSTSNLEHKTPFRLLMQNYIFCLKCIAAWGSKKLMCNTPGCFSGGTANLSGCQRKWKAIIMSAELYNETLKNCQCHVDRLNWSTQQMQPRIPFTTDTLSDLNDIDLASRNH